MVGVEGFEPPTSCSQSRRATRLRYTPDCDLVATAASQMRALMIAKPARVRLDSFGVNTSTLPFAQGQCTDVATRLGLRAGQRRRASLGEQRR